MRKPPVIQAPPVTARPLTGYVTEVRRYKVITPLFGGGVEPGVADPISVVRATEVRGHLRFWWRAMMGGSFATLDDLRRREAEIWGSTEAPSEIQVRVLDDQLVAGAPEVAFRVIRDGNKLKVAASPKIAPYAAFPLLPDKNEQKQAGWESEPVRVDVAFALELTCKAEYANELAAALWAWETFGGIGARTRRGFGALYHTGGDPYPGEAGRAERLIRDRLRQSSHGRGAVADVPLLTPGLKFRVLGPFDNVNKPFRDPVAAWQDALAGLNAFRQARHGSKYGPSKWPEADEIRRRYGLGAKMPPTSPPTEPIRKFPRAAFGLPIVFHMPHDRRISDELTLEGRPDDERKLRFDRLASRLILRPLVCQGGAFALAAVLDGPELPPLGAQLKGSPGDPRADTRLTAREADRVPPLREAKQNDPRLDATDVLAAFLTWL